MANIKKSHALFISIIFSFIRDFFYAYWSDHNDLIDYLLFDYIIALGYYNIPSIKVQIDNVSCFDYNKFALENDLKSKYSIDKFSICYNQTFHKLTWKKKFNKHTRDGKLTMYGHILNTFQ